MAEEKKIDVPSEEGQTSEQPSAGTEADSGKESSEALSQVPDNFKGKSEQELIKMYQNAEKKIGEQSGEVKEARETKKNVEILLGAISSDPDRYKTAQDWIQNYLYGEDQETDKKPGEGGEGVKTAVQTQQSDDTRRVVRNTILTNFYKGKGLDKLPDNERKTEQQKLGNAFAELLDPGGKKPVGKLIEDVPLDKLQGYLESSYIVANREKILKEGQLQGLLSAEENRQASIGSLSSSSEGKGGTPLTPEEKRVADSLGVPHEDYAKNKPQG